MNTSRLATAIKKILAFDLLLGLLIVAMMWNSLGTEGMAAEFCKWAHVERCDEIDWSEEHDPNPQKLEEAEAIPEAPQPPPRKKRESTYGI